MYALIITILMFFTYANNSIISETSQSDNQQQYAPQRKNRKLIKIAHYYSVHVLTYVQCAAQSDNQLPMHWWLK